MQKTTSFMWHLIQCLTLLSLTTQCNESSKDPFTVVIMVKNEESVIIQTLEPFVKAGLQSFLIFDTGSTDATLDTVKDYFKKNSIQYGYIAEEPFIDFATSRNHALDVAEELFPEAYFFLMPDAEWYLHNVKDLIQFCESHKNDSKPCYLMRIFNNTIDFTVTRLIHAKQHARFIGAVHEVIPCNEPQKVPNSIFFELGSSRNGMEKSKKRWERDLAILLKKYAEDPDDSRTLFYLAQTYECLSDFENAYFYYQLRSQIAAWPEEDFEAFYRLGKLTDILSRTNPSYTWHMAQDYYFKAMDILPNRAEPLICLAEHYWPEGGAPKNISLCYLFAKRAYELPYPEDALLFVDPFIYTFRRYQLLSKSAWHIGDYNTGEEATRKALKVLEQPHLLRNLACYIEINAEKNS